MTSNSSEREALEDMLAAPGRHFTTWDGEWTIEVARELAESYGRAVREADKEAVRRGGAYTRLHAEMRPGEAYNWGRVDGTAAIEALEEKS